MALPETGGRRSLHPTLGRLLILLALLPGAAVPTTSTAEAPATRNTPDPGSPAAKTLGLRAELLPREATTLSGELEARIVTLPVREGESFAQGNLLVAFDCDREEARRKRSQAVLEGARAKVEINTRLANRGATSILEQRVAQAEEAKAQAEHVISQVEVGKCQITAPFPGRVVVRHVREHQYVKPGQELLEILNPRQLVVRFVIPSRWIGRIGPGHPFSVEIDETGKSYPAEIHVLGAQINAVSQSIPVWGRLRGEFAELLPGMSGTVILAESPPP